MATITAGDFRNGKTFEYEGKIMTVVEFQHVKPGKGAAFVRTKMKNVVTGAVTETSFNPTAKFEEAFVERKGVCQDITHITLGALREVGIPARYVSGYLHPSIHPEVGVGVTGESHAWVEWFTGDWEGFDPTNRVEIGDRHVLVGRGRDYNDVPPLRGVYAGPYKSDLHVQVAITREA